MAAITPEKYVQNKIIAFLKPLDQYHRGVLYWERRNASGPNYKKGLPDLYVVIGPYHLEIECKAPGGKPSADQERWARIFRKMGAPYLITESYDEFISFITPYLPK